MSTEAGSTVLTEPGGNPTPPPTTDTPPEATTETPPNGATAATTETASPSDLFVEIDDDLKGNDSLSKFLTDGKLNIRSLAKSYQNAERMIGGEKVPVPKDGDEESLELFYKAGGRPDSADEYKLEVPSDLPDGLPDGFYDEEAAKSFRTWAFENGFSQRQAQNLHDRFVKQQAEVFSQYAKDAETSRDEAVNALKRELGSNYDGYMNGAKQALQKFGSEDFNKMLDDTKLGNDPRLIKVFGEIHKELNGATSLTDNPEKTGASNVDIDAQIADFRTKHEAALFDRDHPDHGQRTKQYNKLFEQKFGGSNA